MAKKFISEYGKEAYGQRANGALILTKGEVRKLIDLSGETIKLLEKKANGMPLKRFIEATLHDFARK